MRSDPQEILSVHPQHLHVLMPCRALGAFGLNDRNGDDAAVVVGLNALSGIGCVRTEQVMGWARQYGRLGLNALSGIGCVRTPEGHSVHYDIRMTS